MVDSLANSSILFLVPLTAWEDMDTNTSILQCFIICSDFDIVSRIVCVLY